MNRIKEFCNKCWIYIVVFLIPWIVVMIVSLTNDGWPTGSGSLMRGDAVAQLLPFARGLWDKIHSGESLAYTWNVAGGSDFFAILGYFLSPFTILFIMVPKAFVANMLQIIMVLKWSCAGITMVYYFYNTKYNTLSHHKKIVSLFLGTVFILSSSRISLVKYFQFTDAIICFPVLLLLIERMVDYKKWLLYCAVLTLTIITNSYMAYEICLFLIIWFFFQLDSKTTEKMKKFLMFSASSMLSALCATWFIIKILVISKSRIKINSSSGEILDYAKSIIMEPLDFIQQLFIFSPIHNPYRVEPNIYFSVIGILLVLLFLFIKIEPRKKIYLLTCFVLFVASFFSGALGLIWHLFSIPNGVNHRFSDIFIFLMLFLILNVIIRLDDITTKHVVIVGIIGSVGYIYTFFNIKVYNSPEIYVTTLLLFGLYMILLVLLSRKSISLNIVLTCILLSGFVELLFNSCFLVNDNYNVNSIDDKLTYDMSGLPAFDAVNPDAGERISTCVGFDNAGLYSSKNTLSGFLSSINGNMLNLMNRLGMGTTGHVEYTVKGGSPLVNLMFNLRYIVANSAIDVSNAEIVKRYSGCNLYRTSRLAGLGYMVKDETIDWNPYDKTCFECQNSFAKLSTGINAELFTVINPKVKCTDIEGKEIERDKGYIDNDGYVYNFNSTYGNENDSIQIEFISDEDMDLYIDVRSTFSGGIYTFIDGKMVGMDLDGYSRSTVHLGDIKKGQKISLIILARDDYYVDDDLSVFFRFAKFDNEVYSKVYEKLSKNVYNIETMECDDVKGSIKVEEDGIMMTSIQSDVGFEVIVDGIKTDYESIGGALIGVPLKKGEHIVEFKYVDTTPIYAKAMSISGIVIYVVLLIVSFVKKKRNCGVIVEADI